MFEVLLTMPFDADRFAERDREVYAAAGSPSDYGGAGLGWRDHGWHVPTFGEAVAMRQRLTAVPGARVTIREV